MAVNTAASLTDLVPAYYDKRVLDRLMKKVSNASKDAQRRPLPKGSGTTARFTRFTNLGMGANLDEGAVTSALTETALSEVQVSAALHQLYLLVTTSDLLEMTSITPVMDVTADLLTDSMARTIDRFLLKTMITQHESAPEILSGATYTLSSILAGASCAHTMVACSGVFGEHSWTISGFPRLLVSSVFTNSPSGALSVICTSSSGDLPMKIIDVRDAVTRLRTVDAEPFDDGFYHGYIDPYVFNGLRTDTEWASWHQYTSSDLMEKGALGDVEGVRFFLHTNPFFGGTAFGKSSTLLSGTNTYLHLTPIVGKNSMGLTDFDGAGEIITIPRTKPDSYNATASKSYMSYKVTLAATCLNCSAGVLMASFFEGK